MGGGDLNMKKSWHPGLIKNRAQVWEDQHAALQERKRIEALKKEIEEERAANELQKLNEANGGAKRQERVEFLYAGPGAGANMAEDREAYLLGKKRIDDVLGKDSVGSGIGEKTTVSTATGPNLRDVSQKVALDPLLAIKKQEAAQYKAMIDRKKAEMEAEARKNARRAVKRSRPDEDRHRYSSARYEERDDRRHRRRSTSRDRRRSSSRDRYYSSRRRERSRESRRNPSRKRSYPKSSTRRRSSVSHSPSSDDRRTSRHHDDERDRRRDSRRHSRSPARISGREPTQRTEIDVQERLAAMTSSAKELDDVRARRLEASRAKEDEERRKEESGRSRNAVVDSGFLREMRLADTLVR